MTLSTATAIALNGSTQNALVSGQAFYKGITVRETGGANPVTITVYDGLTATGTILGVHQLAASAAIDVFYQGDAKAARIGITVEKTAGTGTFIGSIFTA